MAEDSTDEEFNRAVKEMAEAGKKLGSVADLMDKMFRDTVRAGAPATDPLKPATSGDTPAALEKPRPVVVVGPKPLPVTGAGGGGGAGGGRAATPTGPRPSEVEDGFIRRRWKESRFGRAQGSTEKFTDDYFWGRHKTGGAAASPTTSVPKGAAGTAAAPGGAAGAAKGMGAGAGGATGAGGASGMAKGAGWAAVVIEGAKALNEFRKAIQEASAEALRNARQYAESSGQMAQVFARKDIQDLLRGQKIGNATAESTGRLADAQSRRQDATAPFEIAMTRIQNNALAFFENKIADTLETMRVWVNKVIEVITLGRVKDFFSATAPDPGDPWGYSRAAAEAAKLDGRRLADIAAAAVAKVKAGTMAPAGAAPAGRLP